MIAVNSSTSFTIVRMNGCTALSSRDRPSIRSVAFRISLMSTPQTTSKMAAEISFVQEKFPKIFWKNPTVEAVPSSSAAPTALAASLTAVAASGASFVRNSTYAPSVGFRSSSASSASSVGAASADVSSASSFGASSLRFSAFT